MEEKAITEFADFAINKSKAFAMQVGVDFYNPTTQSGNFLLGKAIPYFGQIESLFSVYKMGNMADFKIKAHRIALDGPQFLLPLSGD